MVVVKQLGQLGVIHLAGLARLLVNSHLDGLGCGGVLRLDEGRQLDDAVAQLLVAVLQQLLLLKQVHLEIQRDPGDSQNHVDERVYSLVHFVFYLLSDRLGDGTNLVRAFTV